MRVLYVEDNATNVILVQRVANMGKHEVITYDDGQQALDKFEQDKPDLVLLDVQLRGALTGLDVAHALRTKGCKLPIIAVTAYAMKGDRQRCLDAGCDDYLPKPISVAELVTVFKRYGDAAASGKPILSTFKLPTPTLDVENRPAPSNALSASTVLAPEVKTTEPTITPVEPSTAKDEAQASSKPVADAVVVVSTAPTIAPESPTLVSVEP